MGWQTIKQPNGLLAIWSTVVDDFINNNLTVDGVVERYLEGDRRTAAMNLAFAWSKLPKERQNEEMVKFLKEAEDGLMEMVEAVDRGESRDGDWTWDEAVAIVEECHGRKVEV